MRLWRAGTGAPKDSSIKMLYLDLDGRMHQYLFLVHKEK